MSWALRALPFELDIIKRAKASFAKLGLQSG